MVRAQGGAVVLIPMVAMPSVFSFIMRSEVTWHSNQFCINKLEEHRFKFGYLTSSLNGYLLTTGIHV